MRKTLILFLISMSCQNINKNEIIEGEVYIKLIDAVSLYGSSEDFIESSKQKIMDDSDTINLSSSERQIQEYYKSLVKYDLLDKPYFKLKLNNDSIINVFTNEKEYLQIKNDLEKLDRDKEKIYVKFTGEEKENGIYYTDNILAFEKQEGQTDWDK